ncbi:Succinylglutamate desuccinylase / Aspartoacylase family protein [Halogranum amylolyticum]|uniref:Succinylglutamate desuccinylase / Aspartoacylase family protein n=1 Tax=Halogranum amylolyticum TaxID=660520 RepID=A0A1H8PEG5_9EURY|nr:succinylglutamate desuccinylase/aspartoacylase family protein [Halogranum amylolyticum]SEO40389.1 Succinylglutamate desuccinylase / Aspartoacylase family protein [Halogranum amylolyticum]
MTRHTDSATDGVDSVGRRSFLRGATALGVGLAALPGLSSSAAAATDRSSYQMMTGTKYETTVYVYDSGQSGPTTMVVGGIHGDERAGYLAADEIAEWTVDCGKLVVVPRSNVVAIANDSRYVDGTDLNREFPPLGGDCTHPLAEGIWNKVARHDPDWVFDLHSARGIYKSGDGSVGQALFPTWTSPSRSYGENAIADLNDEFGLTGDMAYLMGNTLDADRDMLMHRVAGMLDRPGYTCEVTEKAPLEDGVQWHLYTVEHVMRQYGQHRVSASSSLSTDPPFSAMNLTLDNPWQQYSLGDRSDDPIVIAKPLSIVGDDPCHPRLRRVGHTEFEARIEEWANENGKHYDEQTGAFAIDPGSYTLGDGMRMEVGTVRADTEKTVVRFDEQFDYQPIVLAQTQTYNDSTPVVTRIRGPWTDWFEVYLQMEESKTGQSHGEELVGWIAIERGTGVMNGTNFEANVERDVRSSWHHIDFDRSYDDPVFVAGIQTFNDREPCGLRYKNLTSSGVDVFVEEEDSADLDRTHGEEEVGYLVFEA